ncbi:TPA: hypothetical protein RTF81_001068 [Legionella pneumophila]|nr:hypothetical protein [Legionella pneumophila]
MKWLLSILMISLLSGCSKPPDLESPCQNFGQYCPQYPINEEPITERAK